MLAPGIRHLVPMTTTLITGGNKGLGHEAARRLIDAGHEVWIGARDPERGRTAADELGARFVQLDVTDDASVAAAAETVGSLDVLVNNAGIADAAMPPAVAETGPEDVEGIFATNVLGIVRVTRAFLPLLSRSQAPVIVNVSSGLGSMTVTTTEGRVENSFTALAYPASKAAVNMLTSQYARALPHVRVNCVDPGYTATDLNGNSGPQTVEEGTDAIVAMAQLGPDGPTGTFVDRDGAVAW